jgi:hypothetical protein
MTRWIKRLLALPVALVLLFEEWGWEPLQRAIAWLARWAPLRWLEQRIAALPPYAALAVFVLPSLALLPVKLAALWLIGQGHALAGAGAIVAAKLAGTAVLARLFKLTQPALMTLPWFARAYLRWTAWKTELFAWVRASWAWRWGRVVRRAVARQLSRAGLRG